MRLIVRFGLAVLVGCWSVAGWAAVMGAAPVRQTPDFDWWPGALYAILIAALALAALQTLPPALTDWLQRAAGDGVPLWALFAGLGLLWLVRDGWSRGLAGESAMQLFAIGMGGLCLAGATAPLRPALPSDGLPPLPPEAGAAAQPPVDATRRTITWTGAGTGYTPVEPYSLDAVIDNVRLETQRIAPHDLILARWPGYCVPSQEVREIARELRRLAERQHRDRLDELRLVLSFVADGLGPLATGDDDLPRYPLETLADEQSGPTARTILALTLLAALGYRGALLRAPGRTALAVAGAAPLPELALQVAGEPALFVEFRPDGPVCDDLPPEDKAVPWQIIPVR